MRDARMVGSRDPSPPPSPTSKPSAKRPLLVCVPEAEEHNHREIEVTSQPPPQAGWKDIPPQQLPRSFVLAQAVAGSILS